MSLNTPRPDELESLRVDMRSLREEQRVATASLHRDLAEGFRSVHDVLSQGAERMGRHSERIERIENSTSPALQPIVVPEKKEGWSDKIWTAIISSVCSVICSGLTIGLMKIVVENTK